jgi:hypothetical protein
MSVDDRLLKLEEFAADVRGGERLDELSERRGKG